MQIAGGILFFLAFVAVGIRHSECLRAPLEEKDVDATIFTKEIHNWSQTGYESELFKRYISALEFPTELRNTDWRTFTGSRALSVCTICNSISKTLISMHRNGSPIDIIQKTMTTLCTRMNLQTERVCRGIIELQLPIILYIVDSDPNIDPIDICGVALQNEYCSTVSDKYDWTVEIDENPPRNIAPLETVETMKIVQLTDIHYDPLYEPNGNSHCGEPMCCRKGQNVTNNSDKVAGYWGDYNDCDVPWHAVLDALDHVNNTHQDITYVYFTGDLIDHGVWETTKKGNADSIVKSYDKIKETFPNTPVYPIIGNHEPHPLNVFAPSQVKEENFTTGWLYELSADLWIKYGWLPESTRQTILEGGFYTISPRKGYRIIALNNNVCYTFNWWLLYEPQDPGGQLRWLADTLLEAEKSGEYVHILAHIPSASESCYKTWSREFRKIVNRFAHIIRAQFNGHTHFDEFIMYYDLNDRDKAVNVAWNGGSITAFSNLNPNYKVYEVEAKTFGIANVDTWMFNLTAANQTPEKRPEWYKSYSFKEEYGLNDLSTASLQKWIIDTSRNVSMLEQYRQNFYKRADPSTSVACDDQCLRDRLCAIVTSSPNDETQCHYLTST